MTAKRCGCRQMLRWGNRTVSVGDRRTFRASIALLTVILALAGLSHAAAPQSSGRPPVEAAARHEKPAVLGLINRPIMVMRARLFDMSPEERSQLADQRLRALTRAKPIPPITAVPMDEGTAIKIGEEFAFGIAPDDLDSTSRETMDEAVTGVLERLRMACAAIEEQRSVAFVVKAVLFSLGAVIATAFLVWALRRLETRLIPAGRRAVMRLSQRLAGTGFTMLSYAVKLVTLAVHLPFWFTYALITYSGATFCLGRFPYTQIWAETMGGHIWSILSGLVAAAVGWLPDLLVIVVIVAVTKGFVAVVRGIFGDIESGRLKVKWCDALAARPTVQILVTILWLFALIMVYPYLPGSGSAAFKGIGVFVGLLVSLGASGVIGQVVGGFVLMYSRALQPGDFVRIGDDEGVVEEIGFLSTRLKTPRREAVNVPNAMLLSVTSKNYSSQAGKDGLIVSTGVTIGYNTPWRQVHAMLLEAAGNTPGVSATPAPFVWQTALSDFYAEYQLNVFLKSAHERPRLLSALHANIQDAFNEHGVQIMSPNYKADPPQKVWVPKEKWFTPPAPPAAQRTKHKHATPAAAEIPGAAE